MKTSETVTKIATALLKAQREMDVVIKDSTNPYFKSSYADINSFLDVVLPVLNANDIILLQPTFTTSEGDFIDTTLLHESGEFVSSQTKIVSAKQNDPQALGSAITYSRRYGVQSLLAMKSSDDDGEAAMNRTTTRVKSTETSIANSISKPVASFRKPGRPAKTTSQTTIEEVKETKPEELNGSQPVGKFVKSKSKKAEIVDKAVDDSEWEQ